MSGVIAGKIELASLMLNHCLLPIKQPITFKEGGWERRREVLRREVTIFPRAKRKKKTQLFIRKILEFGQFYSFPLIQM